MARGWDSKAVESQQDDAARRAPASTAASPAEGEAVGRRHGLEMALAQTQAELGAACRPAHRDMLHLRLGAIREQLRDLS